METATNVQNLRQQENKIVFDCKADLGFHFGN